LKKGFNKNVYPLNIKPQLLEKQNSSWWNVKSIMKNNIKYKLSKIDDSKNTYYETTALRVVPLPDFTIYPANIIKPQDNLFINMLKIFFWRKNYLNLSDDQCSPFLKFLYKEENEILYDNPAIEACIEFKWMTSRNHFLWRLLTFIIFSVIVYISDKFYVDYKITILILVVFFYLGYHFLVIEIAQFINEGRKKYLNIYNVFDVGSIIISIVAVISWITISTDKQIVPYMILSSFAVLTLCIEFVSIIFYLLYN
jgi:hypothetical protein